MKKDSFIQHNNQVLNMLDEVNSFSNYSYDEAVRKAKKLVSFRILLSEGRFKEAVAEEHIGFFNQLKPKYRIIVRFKACCPGITKMMLEIRNSCKSLLNK